MNNDNNDMSSQEETPMFWKVEPLSPSGTPPLDDNDWLLFEEKPAVLVGLRDDDDDDDFVLYEEQLTRAQIASKILEELELKPWIKEEESFADWLEEKIDIPIFEELPAPECGQNRAVTAPYPAKPQPIHVASLASAVAAPPMVIGAGGVDTTQSLLREFESVLGDVAVCHQIASTTTLTPPQSPPPILCKQQPQQHHLIQPLQQQQQAHLLVSLQPMHHQQAFVYQQQQQPSHHQYHEESAAITTLQGQPQPTNAGYSLSLTNNNSNNDASNDQQQHIADQWTAENLSLDPLVHSGDVAQELAQVDEYVRSCAEDVAPSPSCSSSISCTSEDSSDPDWSFDQSSSPSTSSGSPRKITNGSSGRGRRGSKPYSRPNVEDKRVRKKEQNKNAATRYRQKKKQEIKDIVGEEQELNSKNEKLHAKVKDLQREIGYLKGLMRDLFKAKGLIE